MIVIEVSLSFSNRTGLVMCNFYAVKSGQYSDGLFIDNARDYLVSACAGDIAIAVSICNNTVSKIER